MNDHRCVDVSAMLFARPQADADATLQVVVAGH